MDKAIGVERPNLWKFLRVPQAGPRDRQRERRFQVERRSGGYKDLYYNS
jgi:hypothetical protein